MKTFIVSGLLIAKTPIAVSPPGVAFFNDDPKKHPKRLPRAGTDFKAERYIPASTLRNKIRYGVSAAVLEALKASGHEIPLSALLALSTGFTKMKKSAKGKVGKNDKSVPQSPETQSDDDGATFEADAPAAAAKNGKKSTENQKAAKERLAAERRVRENNPFLSLLGEWGLASELRVSNAMPRSNGRDNMYAVSPGEVRKELSEALVSSLTDDDLRQYEALLDEGSQKEKDSTGLKYIGPGWEEIVAGTECDWSIRIHRATDLKVGAVLAALRLFAAEPIIGAHKALGRGEIALSMSGRFVEQQFLAAPCSTPAGDLTLGFGEFAVTGGMASCLAVFDEQARQGFPGLHIDDFEIVKPDDEG